MPPRRSARVAAVAERESSALPPLPLSLALFIFALLPVDARLRCREVCRGWRAVLLERSLWLRLDMSPKAGLARPARDALLRAAAARAGGQLQFLDVSECKGITHACLLAVLAANAGALRELRVWTAHGIFCTEFTRIEELLRAAPQLCVFDADILCGSVAEAQRLLRKEGAFAPLRLRKLNVLFVTQTEADVLSLAEDSAAHASLVDLYLVNAPLDTPAALDALVAAALANRFSALSCAFCRLSPASTPALARLLGGDALRSLYIANKHTPLLDAATAAVLGDALRANGTLEQLLLMDIALWRDPAVAVTLLGSITAHRSLWKVSLACNPIGDAQDATGAAFGALVAADAPALLYLDLRDCDLQEAALGPLLDALPANTHLRTLLLGEVTASAEFVRERLLPAVRTNMSLLELEITVTGEGESAARDAQEIVNSRAAR
jgi:hypothetical protein